jgi:hypothetical protein
MTRFRKALFPATLAALAALLACAAARQVVIEPRGGVVAIPRNTPANRAEAVKIMAGRCANGYDITREEEVVIGRDWREDTSVRPDRIMDDLDVSRTSTIRDRTEWRISYSCK